MIGDRDMFVIGQKRIVRSEQLADILCMVDASIKIGVVTDLEWQLHLHIGLTIQMRLYQGFVRVVGQQGEKAMPQVATRSTGQGKQSVERFHAECGLKCLRKLYRDCAQIDNPVADRNRNAGIV